MDLLQIWMPLLHNSTSAAEDGLIKEINTFLGTYYDPYLDMSDVFFNRMADYNQLPAVYIILEFIYFFPWLLGFLMSIAQAWIASARINALSTFVDFDFNSDHASEPDLRNDEQGDSETIPLVAVV